MSSSSKRKRSKQDSSGKKNKQTTFQRYQANPAAAKALREKHLGKRLLIASEDLYNDGCVPENLEGLLCMYSVKEIDDEAKFTTLHFENTCIEEGANKWINFHDTTGQSDLDNYRLAGLGDAHELYNKHLGLVNAAAYEKKEAESKKADELKVAAASDLSDIEQKIANNVDKFQLLLGEFEAVGAVEQHTITQDIGDNVGKGKLLFCYVIEPTLIEPTLIEPLSVYLINV